jgi:hypothetical protein
VTPTQRLVDKLSDPRATYTSAQMAYLMGVAAQWARDVVDGEPSKLSYRAGFHAGYQARVQEENADYPPPPLDLLPDQRSVTRQVYRSRCGADQVGPREGDFPGYGDEYVQRLRDGEVVSGGSSVHAAAEG